MDMTIVAVLCLFIRNVLPQFLRNKCKIPTIIVE